MLTLTDFADQAVILPVVFLTAAAFFAAGWWRAALVWICVVPGTLFVVLFTKLCLLGCGPIVPGFWELRSPSGHTASAALICGGLGGLMIPRRERLHIALLLAAGAAVLVGCSRLFLGAHTFADVVAGAVIGILGTYILVRHAGVRPKRLRYMPGIIIVLLTGVAISHGFHLQVEPWINVHAFSLETAFCVD